jgi:hypothetical protein
VYPRPDRRLDDRRGCNLKAVLAGHDPAIAMSGFSLPYGGVRGIEACRENRLLFSGWLLSGAVFQIEALNMTPGTGLGFACRLLRWGTFADLARRPGQAPAAYRRDALGRRPPDRGPRAPLLRRYARLGRRMRNAMAGSAEA